MSSAALVARGLLVLLVLGAALWLVKRADRFGGARKAGALQVLGSARVGKGATVTIVRIGDAEYALGVTDGQVNLLTRTETTGAAEPEPAATVQRAAGTPRPRTRGAAAGRKALSAEALGRQLGAALRSRFARTSTPVALPRPAGRPDTFAAVLADVADAPRSRPAAAPLDPRSELLDDVLLEVLGAANSQPRLQICPPSAEDVDDVPAPKTHRSPQAPATDGSAATPRPRTRPQAATRTAARMDAPTRLVEEHPWSRSCPQRAVRAQRARLDREACLR